MNRGREILGSLCAVTAGTLANGLAWGTALFLISICKGGIRDAAQIGLVYVFFVLLIGGALALATWAAAFVWIYLYVPRESPLWKWPLCTVCGGVAGGAIAAAVALPYGIEGPILWFAASGLIVGAATCLFAALTAHIFRQPCRSGSSRSCL